MPTALIVGATRGLAPPRTPTSPGPQESNGLRHAEEGRGNYATCKTALDMIGKLLSLDLKDRRIRGNALLPVTPDDAAASLIPFIDSFTLDMSGELWPPIGTAEDVLGKNLPVSLQLPW
ncbi:hypothetical protein C8R46DRAFT_1278898 [Mycena filopes]|nr:hypothetical protein C8R46DRAFT_1278898 [Mycena filopes]